MTTIFSSVRKCFHCQKESEQRELGSTNRFGACDLDGRPPEMFRSSMSCWVQECPHCGYVGRNLTDSTTAPAELIESEGYRTYDGIAFESELAKRFYRLYLIKMAERDAKGAFWSSLRAAWSSDDARDSASAVKCRRLALAPLNFLIKKRPNEDRMIIKLDLLRRVGEFDEVVAYYATTSFQDKFLAKLAAFEVELARKKDDACYSVDDVAPTD
ncbi:MAG: hypothetical protein IJL92_02635 [Thermoguttaceae bacterium]|nr:hypothetical protein [Thermoguttaceae bacterium]